MDSTWTQNKPENSRVSFLLNYFEVPIKKKIFGVTNSSKKNYDFTIFPNQKKKKSYLQCYSNEVHDRQTQKEKIIFTLNLVFQRRY